MKILIKNSFLILVLIGFLFSVYLTYVHYFLIDSYLCGVEKKCDEVLTSKYSEFLNLPISLWGVIYFMILIFFWLLRKNILFIPIFNFFLKFLILGGIFVALVSIYLQLVVIKAICIYCLIIDLVLLILPFSLKKIYSKI